MSLMIRHTKTIHHVDIISDIESAEGYNPVGITDIDTIDLLLLWSEEYSLLFLRVIILVHG
jgi:hypothetical protein